MKIRSFGCSFLSGEELLDKNHTWPALIAKSLNLKHANHANGGCGNLQILETILHWADRDSICFINWTWTNRFDLLEPRVTMRPSLDTPLAKTYFSSFHNEYHDILTSFIYIKTAIDHLQQQKIPFIMTYVDELLFSPISSWSGYVKARSSLQQYIRPHLQLFDGRTFLDWAKYHQFKFGTNHHPLEDAHRAAANYWKPAIESILRKV